MKRSLALALLGMVACRSSSPTTVVAPQPAVCPSVAPAPAVAPTPTPTQPSIAITCKNTNCRVPDATVSHHRGTDGAATVMIDLRAPTGWTLPCSLGARTGGFVVCKSTTGPVGCKTADERDACVVTAPELVGDQATRMTLVRHVAAPVPQTVEVELRWALCNKEGCVLEKGTAVVTFPNEPAP